MENKLDYIIEKIKNIQKIQILELGVQNGSSTKKFIELCTLNDGFLTSIDIDDCSKVIKSDRWKFIHSSDDDFEKIDKIISKSLDFIFIDSLHEPNHVEKVFYHYYSFLKTFPNFISSGSKFIYYKIINNEKKKWQYKMRFLGLFNSYMLKKSFYRPYNKKN